MNGFQSRCCGRLRGGHPESRLRQPPRARGITGVVKDVSGGAPGVTVTVTSETTRASVDSITNGDGVYTATAARVRLLSRRGRAGRLRGRPQMSDHRNRRGEGRHHHGAVAADRVGCGDGSTRRRGGAEVPIPVSVIKGDLWPMQVRSTSTA